MADHITLELAGWREAVLALDSYTEGVERTAREKLRDACEEARSGIQADAPVGRPGYIRLYRKQRTGKNRGQRYSVQAWHEPGDLRNVTIKYETYGVNAKIRVNAPHAHLVEWGRKGTHEAKPHAVGMIVGGELIFRMVKATPPTAPRHFFVPHVVAARRRYYEYLKEALARHIVELGPGLCDVVEGPDPNAGGPTFATSTPARAGSTWSGTSAGRPVTGSQGEWIGG